MIRKVLWILMVSLAFIIGFYPIIYFLIDRKFGLLGSKSDELLANIVWNTGFYTHIIFGGLALLIGWMQFSPRLRINIITLHRQIGKIYLIAVFFSSIASIYIGFYATGGLISCLGFICLGIIWFYTTLKAYVYIKNKRVEQHRKLMIYSYAACFADVTLRIWLPFLQTIFGDFDTAYRIVAWLCWIPNLIVASIIARQLDTQKSINSHQHRFGNMAAEVLL
jgi:uncharacterized membrane protein